MDVKTTFLKGNLFEEVYMTQLQGFISENGSKVCKLQSVTPQKCPRILLIILLYILGMN